MHARTARMMTYTARIAARLEQLGLHEDALLKDSIAMLRAQHEELWDEEGNTVSKKLAYRGPTVVRNDDQQEAS